MDREIFSPSEIQAIVQRRRESEYLLRRRVARKADFLRYIEAEELLEELRKVRTQKKERDHRQSVKYKEDDNDDDNPNQKKKQEKHIGDIHILQLIHLLFARAIRKFRSDLSLHLLHVDVCKRHKSWTKLSRVYAEALQIFPSQEGLWIEAASHEFFDGPRKSIRNARILLQRGIRKLARKSQNLWIEYFSLELHYAQTLRGRRQILIHGGQPSEKDEKDDDEGDDDVDKSGEGGAEALEEDSSYKIATIVYKNAIQSIPDSIEFRLHFLDTCRKFPDTKSLMNMIQEQVQQDFGSQHPEAWIARAVYEAEKTETPPDETTGKTKRPSKKARTKDPVVAVLEEGMAVFDTIEMKLHAFRFAMRYTFEQEELGNRDSVKQSQELAHSIIKACEGQTESPDLALEQVEYFLAQGDTELAIGVLATFCTESKKEVPSTLWIRWASLFGEEDHSKAKAVLKRGLGQISLSKTDHMCVLLQYFGCLLHDKESNKAMLNDTFQRILLLAPTAWEVDIVDVSDYWFGMRCLGQAYLGYLNLASSEESLGPEVARKIYESILFRSTVHLLEDSPNFGYLEAFVDETLRLEEVSKNKVQLCRVYDKAIEIFQKTSLAKHYRQRKNDGAVFSL
jgi:U3 small nucleolar RNA-associated protein 6